MNKTLKYNSTVSIQNSITINLYKWCLKNRFLLLYTSLLLLSNVSYAQKLFLNTNTELCIELYTAEDPSKKFAVCMVVETLTSTDSIVLKKWSNLSDNEKQRWTQQWTALGYRIEAENYPLNYIKNQPFIKSED